MKLKSSAFAISPHRSGVTLSGVEAEVVAFAIGKNFKLQMPESAEKPTASTVVETASKLQRPLHFLWNWAISLMPASFFVEIDGFLISTSPKETELHFLWNQPKIKPQIGS